LESTPGKGIQGFIDGDSKTKLYCRLVWVGMSNQTDQSS